MRKRTSDKLAELIPEVRRMESALYNDDPDPPTRPPDDHPPPPPPPPGRTEIPRKEVMVYQNFDYTITPNSLREIATGTDIPLGDYAPYAKAVQMHDPTKFSKQRPLVIGCEGGIYNQLMFAGSEWSATFLACMHESGLPLHVAIVAIDPENRRPVFRTITYMSKHNPTGLFHMSGLDISNNEKSSACIRMNAAHDKIDCIVEDDIRLMNPLEGSNAYGGAGTKWGAHNGHHIKDHVVKNVRRKDDTVRFEEHSRYKKTSGNTQFLDCDFGGGNRTGFQATCYSDDPRPSGDFLVDNCRVHDLGQNWEPHNGGSAMTFSGHPDGIVELRDCEVIDSRYGGLAVWDQNSAHQNEDGTCFDRVVIDGCTFDNDSDDPGEWDGDRYSSSFEAAKEVVFKGTSIHRGGGLTMNVDSDSVPVLKWTFARDAKVMVSRLVKRDQASGNYKTIVSAPPGELIDVANHPAFG